MLPRLIPAAGLSKRQLTFCSAPWNPAMYGPVMKTIHFHRWHTWTPASQPCQQRAGVSPTIKADVANPAALWSHYAVVVTSLEPKALGHTRGKANASPVTNTELSGWGWTQGSGSLCCYCIRVLVMRGVGLILP